MNAQVGVPLARLKPATPQESHSADSARRPSNIGINRLNVGSIAVIIHNGAGKHWAKLSFRQKKPHFCWQ